MGSSGTAANSTQEEFSSTPYPSTPISTFTASKDELFNKLHRIKMKEVELQSKLDGGFYVPDTSTTSGTITKNTPDFSTTKIPLSSPSLNSTISNLNTTSQETYTSQPPLLPKTDQPNYSTTSVTATD